MVVARDSTIFTNNALRIHAHICVEVNGLITVRIIRIKVQIRLGRVVLVERRVTKSGLTYCDGKEKLFSGILI